MRTLYIADADDTIKVREVEAERFGWDDYHCYHKHLLLVDVKGCDIDRPLYPRAFGTTPEKAVEALKEAAHERMEIIRAELSKLDAVVDGYGVDIIKN